jgi:tetratricopeptide (TPR) repeat protein
LFAEGRRGRFAAVIGIVLILVSLSVFAFRHYWLRAEEARLAEGSTVFLTNIHNATGDVRFDNTTELVRYQLLQSPYFSLLDSENVRNTLAQMVKPDDAELDPPTAREVAMRNGARRVVFGTLSRVGDSYVLDLDVEQPDNSPLRFRQHWQNHWAWDTSGSGSRRGSNGAGGSNKDMPSGFLAAVRDSSDWIRQQIGESSNDVARVDAPPEDVTTSNWEALSEFTQAEKFRAARNNDAAVVALRNAVAADPNFALAYARLGDILVSLSRFTEGYAAYEKALSLGQERLTRRERDRISGIYASDAWDYAKAEEIFRDYTTYYPRDYLGWFYRATPLMMMGRTEEAIASLKKAAEIDPARMFAPSHIARFDLILGKYDDAARWIQQLRDHGHNDIAGRIEGQSDFLQGRYDEAENLFRALKDSNDPLYQSNAYSLLVRLYAERGEYRKALEASEQGVAADLDTGDSAHRADRLLDRASINCSIGQYDDCLRDVELSLDLDRSWQRSLCAATLIGRAAGITGAGMNGAFALKLQSIEAKLPAGDVRPLSEIVRMRVHGEVLLAAGKWQPALDDFRKADQLEGPALNKGYLGRALTATAAHAHDEASARQLREEALAAYAVIVQRPGLVWQWPVNWLLDFAPGCLSDEVLSYAKLLVSLGRREEAERLLETYVSRRSSPDPDSRPDREARALLTSTH